MFLLGQIEGTTILFLGGLALTCGVLLFRTHRQLAVRPKAELPSPSGWSQSQSEPRPAHRLDAPKDLRRWEVEAHGLARELNAQLDTKIGILEELIRQATRQAERLEAAIELAAAVAPQAAAEKKTPVEPSVLRIDAAGTRAGASAARRQTEIYALADQGLSTPAIATRIGSPIGEVELILGLRGSLKA
ncbi:MAG TPA: hypothetical protein VNH11_25280 [Pirellulales bacterium]|nr:hypothetical protein [Pirellulales bacterium]